MIFFVCASATSGLRSVAWTRSRRLQRVVTELLKKATGFEAGHKTLECLCLACRQRRPNLEILVQCTTRHICRTQIAAIAVNDDNLCMEEDGRLSVGSQYPKVMTKVRTSARAHPGFPVPTLCDATAPRVYRAKAGLGASAPFQRSTLEPRRAWVPKRSRRECSAGRLPWK